MRRYFAAVPLVAALFVAGTAALHAQGVTTGSIAGRVTDAGGAALAEARITAVHTSSGTHYLGTSRADGKFTIPGMRVGGPYRVTAMAIGYEAQAVDSVYVTLGLATDVRITLRQAAVALQEITVTGERDPIFSSERTGAATTISREALERLPSISGRIADYIKLTPEARGSRFVGMDDRFNNITVDGSYFNNSFGLAGQPGDRTNVAPISMEAIEQLQVNIAPYDVRQGNFIGAGVNTVTKSGTNEYSGSLYYWYRNDGLVGKTAGPNSFDPGTFKYNNIGLRLSGPIIKDKLFFFGSYEDDGITQPGTTFRANTGSETPGGSITRVLASDLDQLSTYLQNNFGYATGGYQGYDFETPAKRILGKLDYNLDQRNKISVRYTHLDSKTDVLASNSSSLGFGSRRSSTQALNFENTNYQILENIRSIVGEWNSTIGRNKANNLIVGYTYQDESRDTRGGSFFPMVDILNNTTTYTTFGFEPFTPNNELRYKTFQIQNSFSIYGAKHDQTFGFSYERYQSENVFFPGSQSAYVYNSLADFYTDANGYLANPNRTTSPVTLRRFQVRWSNIPGLEKPIQPLKVNYAGLYAQDEWRVTSGLKITMGLRVDVPFFENTGFANAQVDQLTFRDETGANVKYSTTKMPGANLLWSPRVGFNWDVNNDRVTQIRGGTGIFTGRPAYVWISNQIGDNGVLTGFEQLDNTTLRPFNPDPDHYKPATVTGAPASSYALSFTDPDFKFPQVWRSNIAVDRRLPWGLTGTGEFLYTRDVNGIYYINANLQRPNTAIQGPGGRPRWTNSSTANRIYTPISSAIILRNENDGYSWNVSGSLERQFRGGFFGKAGYSYGVSKNIIDPGSISSGSWTGNQIAIDPNNPPVAYSSNSPGHRVFATASYKREYFGFGATTLTLFWEARTLGNFSYTFSGDLNNDGGTSNDLIYIPKDMSEMNFQQYNATVSGTVYTFTVDQQKQAWDAYINQDKYLSAHRGEFAERGAVFLPMVKNLDVSIQQEVFTDLVGRRNRLQFRLDIQNFGNLLNSDWGVGKRAVNTQPLISQGVDSFGKALYRLRNIGTELMSKTFEPTSGFNDVYRVQLSGKYFFN